MIVARNWYHDLEVVDSEGTCAVVRAARIVKEPVLAKLLGRMVEVEIQESETLTKYDVQAFRDRVMEFLSRYPDMYQSAGLYDDILRRTIEAETTAQIVRAFMD